MRRFAAPGRRRGATGGGEAATGEGGFEHGHRVGLPAVSEARQPGAHLFGIRVPAGTELGRLQQRLRERAVHVSIRSDAVRVAPHVYNTPDDVDALAEALREAAG